jgi:hypothetical protein
MLLSNFITAFVFQFVNQKSCSSHAPQGVGWVTLSPNPQWMTLSPIDDAGSFAPMHPERIFIMNHELKPIFKPRTARLSVRMATEHYDLVHEAAEREGLQISSFIIMLLVRFDILPESCLKRIKRRPVPFFNALHGLLGIVNKIGGNCKQLAVALPNTDGLIHTHDQIVLAAAAITDALQGRKIPEGVNLYRLQGDITQQGHVFNQIVKSVNAGNPSVNGLPAVLHSIARSAVTITAALNGNLIEADEVLTEMAMDEMRDAICNRPQPGRPDGNDGNDGKTGLA